MCSDQEFASGASCDMRNAHLGDNLRDSCVQTDTSRERTHQRSRDTRPPKIVRGAAASVGSRRTPVKPSSRPTLDLTARHLIILGRQRRQHFCELGETSLTPSPCACCLSLRGGDVSDGSGEPAGRLRDVHPAHPAPETFPNKQRAPLQIHSGTIR